MHVPLHAQLRIDADRGQQALAMPLGQAIVVLVCAALLARYFFRVAWVVDEETREP